MSTENEPSMKIATEVGFLRLIETGISEELLSINEKTSNLIETLRLREMGVTEEEVQHFREERVGALLQLFAEERMEESFLSFIKQGIQNKFQLLIEQRIEEKFLRLVEQGVE